MLFVDYGNTETCTNMYNVTPELMDVRVVGINCQMDGISWVGVEAKATVSGAPPLFSGASPPFFVGPRIF